jgi:hypothetical protein
MENREQKLRLAMERRKKQNPGKDMRQTMPVLFTPVCYAVESSCVRREK